MIAVDALPPIHSRAVSAITDLLGRERILTLACIRPDGWPQATTLGYVNEGLNLYVMVARDSQTFANLTADTRASVAIRTSGGAYGEGVGVSMTGRFEPVDAPGEVERLQGEVARRYPGVNVFCPSSDPSILFRFTPSVIAAVGIAGGRSDPQTFRLGEPKRTVPVDKSRPARQRPRARPQARARVKS